MLHDAKANEQQIVTSDYLEAQGIPWASRDDLPRLAELRDSGKPFVLNLDSERGPGTHWVAARLLGSVGFYADPFGTALGGYPPKSLELLNSPHRWVTNPKQWQPLSSQACGYYAARFCRALDKVTERTTQRELVKLLKACIV